MKCTRRKFLFASALAAGASGAWLGWSQSRSARILRTIIADTKRRVPPAPFKPTPADWSDNAVTLSWLGHATVLINFYGFRILTDPVFSDRCGISFGIGTLGPKRLIAPALALSELPPIDLVLLSHAHMDHFDLPSLRQLVPASAVITAKATSDLLRHRKPQEISELAWGENKTLPTRHGDLRVEAFEVQHWGQRVPGESMRRGYNGYILRREGRALLFGGDTANTPLFADLRSRGPFDVAIMPIGAYNPWIRNHCTPEEALAMANAAGAKYVLPIHHQTFKLSDEPMQEPGERMQAALQRESERLGWRQLGETFVCPRA